jgi:TatD DNase family protein
LIDSHAHLTLKQYKKDLASVLRRAKERGVTDIVTVGVDVESSENGVRLADIHEQVYATVGVHPHGARTLDDFEFEKIEHLAGQPKVVAIGEIGLDFYRNLSPRRSQERAFRRQITLAKKNALPVVIHDREAHQRTIEILKAEKVSHGVLHCFSGDINMARQGLEMGFYISFAGPITYGGKTAVDIIRRIPVDRILIETDCPYLTPVPHRGERNEPAYVGLVLERVAEILGRPVDELDCITEANTRTLFNLPESV